MLKKRIITAVVGIPLLLLAVYFGGWALVAPLLVLAGIAADEYFKLLYLIKCKNKLLYGLLGVAYIAVGFLAFAGLRLGNPDWRQVLLLLFTVWVTDTGAFEIGRRFGKHKMAPKISPNKSWEGAFGGLFVALLIAGGYAVSALGINIVNSLLIVAIGSVAGQIGDLIESKVKRLAKVKDSGTIFPGHGGVLDRFDSILLAAPVVYLLLLLA